jgi:hypothetical protein
MQLAARWFMVGHRRRHRSEGNPQGSRTAERGRARPPPCHIKSPLVPSDHHTCIPTPINSAVIMNCCLCLWVRIHASCSSILPPKGSNYALRVRQGGSCLTKFLVNNIYNYIFKLIYYENIFHNLFDGIYLIS